MLTRLRLENFKSWKDTEDIPMKPITGLFGTNSSGKTSLLQALLLMKQTVDSSDRGVALEEGLHRRFHALTPPFLPFYLLFYPSYPDFAIVLR